MVNQYQTPAPNQSKNVYQTPAPKPVYQTPAPNQSPAYNSVTGSPNYSGGGLVENNNRSSPVSEAVQSLATPADLKQQSIAPVSTPTPSRTITGQLSSSQQNQTLATPEDLRQQSLAKNLPQTTISNLPVKTSTIRESSTIQPQQVNTPQMSYAGSQSPAYSQGKPNYSVVTGEIPILKRFREVVEAGAYATGSLVLGIGTLESSRNPVNRQIFSSYVGGLVPVTKGEVAFTAITFGAGSLLRSAAPGVIAVADFLKVSRPTLEAASVVSKTVLSAGLITAGVITIAKSDNPARTAGGITRDIFAFGAGSKLVDEGFSAYIGYKADRLINSPARNILGRDVQGIIYESKDYSTISTFSERVVGKDSAATLQMTKVRPTDNGGVSFSTVSQTRTRIFDPQTRNYLLSTSEPIRASGNIPKVRTGQLQTFISKGASYQSGEASFGTGKYITQYGERGIFTGVVKDQGSFIASASGTPIRAGVSRNVVTGESTNAVQSIGRGEASYGKLIKVESYKSSGDFTSSSSGGGKVLKSSRSSLTSIGSSASQATANTLQSSSLSQSITGIKAQAPTSNNLITGSFASPRQTYNQYSQSISPRTVSVPKSRSLITGMSVAEPSGGNSLLQERFMTQAPQMSFRNEQNLITRNTLAEQTLTRTENNNLGNFRSSNPQIIGTTTTTTPITTNKTISFLTTPTEKGGGFLIPASFNYPRGTPYFGSPRPSYFGTGSELRPLRIGRRRTGYQPSIGSVILNVKSSSKPREFLGGYALSNRPILISPRRKKRR